MLNQESYELRDGELIRIDIPTDATGRRTGSGQPTRLRTELGSATSRILLAGCRRRRRGFPCGYWNRHVVQLDAHTASALAARVADRSSIVSADVESRVETVKHGSLARRSRAGVLDNATTTVAAVVAARIFLNSSGSRKPVRLLYSAAGERSTRSKSAPASRRRRHRGHTALHRVVDGTSIPTILLLGIAHSTGPRPTAPGGYGGFAARTHPGTMYVGRPLARGFTLAVAIPWWRANSGPDRHRQAGVQSARR